MFSRRCCGCLEVYFLNHMIDTCFHFEFDFFVSSLVIFLGLLFLLFLLLNFDLFVLFEGFVFFAFLLLFGLGELEELTSEVL